MNKKLAINLLSIPALIFLMSNLSISGTLIVEPNEVKTSTQNQPKVPMGTAIGGAGNTAPIAKASNLYQKITCWQNGELILEQAVIPPTDKSSEIKTITTPAKSMDIMTLDFKNAFCLIK